MTVPSRKTRKKKNKAFLHKKYLPFLGVLFMFTALLLSSATPEEGATLAEESGESTQQVLEGEPDEDIVVETV